MIQLVSLTKSFGDRVLFDNVTWQISDGDRVGLCGPNGAGKTTLLRMLAGLEEMDAGALVKPSDLKVGYLPQDGLTHEGRTLYEEASLAFQPLLEMKAEMHGIEERLGDASVPEDEHNGILARYSDLQDHFRLSDGYSIDLKLATVLAGLGFTQDDWNRPTETFSGGWQMRLALAKLLLARPNLLLLDEPTNHLDLEARNWLEEFLNGYPHAVILVSHDRFFLDAVVTRIADLNLRTLTDYPGNYSHYLEDSHARIERLRQEKKEQDEEVARMQMFISRFRYQATKAAQVQSRIKMLEKVKPIEVPPERKRVHFTFPRCAKSGRTVLELHGVRKAYGELVVFGDLDLHIERGDRIALIGRNGAGKSTLMRMLSGVEMPDRGTRQEGHNVVTEYFAQDEAVKLNPDLTVYETLVKGSPEHMVPAIRNILGGFLFSGDDIYKKCAVLSGGERTRLAVARMLLRPSNTLLLDEPTNHLDLDSKDVLLDALMDYGGTLIIVSHDRYFIDRLATKTVEVGGGEAVLHLGTYEELLWRKANQAAGTAGANARPAPSPSTKARGSLNNVEGSGRSQSKGVGPKTGESRAVGSKTSNSNGAGRRPGGAAGSAARVGQKSSGADPHVGLNGGSESKGAGPKPNLDRDERKRAANEAKRLERERRKLEARIADLEARIADREQAIKELESSMAVPGFYDDRSAANAVIARHQALMWEVGDLMHQWEQLQTDFVS
jgi:ATP-binding cassette, subfamily F, member 3